MSNELFKRCCDYNRNEDIFPALCNADNGMFKDIYESMHQCFSNNNEDESSFNYSYFMTYIGHTWNPATREWVQDPPITRKIVSREEALTLLKRERSCINALKKDMPLENIPDIWEPHPESPEKYDPCKFMNETIQDGYPQCKRYSEAYNDMRSRLLKILRNRLYYDCQKENEGKNPSNPKPEPIIRTEAHCNNNSGDYRPPITIWSMVEGDE